MSPPVYYEVSTPGDQTAEAVMKIKQLDASIVLCENPGCDRSAVYLFTQTSPQLMCAAFCENHGVGFAKRFELALPTSEDEGAERRVVRRA
jgi:hypothetical protein